MKADALVLNFYGVAVDHAGGAGDGSGRGEGNGGDHQEPRAHDDLEFHARQLTANSPRSITHGHPASGILGQRRAKECCVQVCCGRGKLFRYIGHLNRAAMAVGVTDILWELEDVARLAER